jgi:hypothetical protein
MVPAVTATGLAENQVVKEGIFYGGGAKGQLGAVVAKRTEPLSATIPSASISHQVGLHFLVPLITRVHCPVARLIEANLTVLEARSSCHPETYR